MERLTDGIFAYRKTIEVTVETFTRAHLMPELREPEVMSSVVNAAAQAMRLTMEGDVGGEEGGEED